MRTGWPANFNVDTVFIAARRLQNLDQVLCIRLVGLLSNFIDTKIYSRTTQPNLAVSAPRLTLFSGLSNCSSEA